MRWQEGRRSDNVEDRRGMRVGRPVAVGGGGLLVIVLLMALCGGDPRQLLQILNQAQGTGSIGIEEPGSMPGIPDPSLGPQDSQADFVSVVLASTEDTWSRIFAASGSSYRPPTLVLFTDMPSGEIFYVSADRLPSGGQDPIRRVLLRSAGGDKTVLDVIREKNKTQGKTPATRADLRLSLARGEVYLINKGDGTIRRIVP